MADNLGLTIKFRGDTIEFKDDLNGVNNALKLLKADAKALNKELKLDPTNTKLMEESLENLKEQQKLLTKAVQDYKHEIDGMTINTADDEKKILNLRNGLSDCETMLRKVNEQIDLFNVKDISNFGNQLSNVSKNLNAVSGVLGEIANAFALLSTASAGALAVGIKYNATLEQNTIALTTALGSEQEALETIAKIQKDAQSTPWSVSELIGYNRTLIATGLSAEESEKIILSLGDAVSAVGGSSDVFSRMVQNLQQIKNAGNATAMDIRQFANAGIDIYGILSTYLGKTTEQITEQDRTWENIIGALQMASSEGGKYFGAMENQSESLTSQLSKLKDEFEQALGDITESLLPTIKTLIGYVKSFATWLKSLSDEQKDVIGKILLITASITPLFKGLQMLTGGVGGLTGKLSPLLKNKDFLKSISNLRKYISGNGGILSTITTLGKTGLSSLISPLKSVISLVTGLGSIFKTYGFSGTIFAIAQQIGGLVSKLGSLISPVTAIIGVLALAYANSEDFRNAISNLVSTIGTLWTNVLQPILALVMSLVTNLITTLGTLLLPLITNLSSFIGDTLAWVINTILVPALQWVIEKFDTLVGWIKEAKDWIGQVYEKFKESEAFETISSALGRLGEIFDAIIGKLKDIWDWAGRAIDRLKELFSSESLKAGISYADNVNPNISYGGGISYDHSGGFGNGKMYSSGGYNFTINVTNTGGSLNANSVKQWARLLTDQINENLGKEM